jgi:hypothetical protein
MIEASQRVIAMSSQVGEARGNSYKNWFKTEGFWIRLQIIIFDNNIPKLVEII